jgi:hypothetical protein
MACDANTWSCGKVSGGEVVAATVSVNAGKCLVVLLVR